MMDRRRLIVAVVAAALVAGVGTVIGLSGRPSSASAASLCTSPTFTSSNPNATDNTDPGPVENWWVNNDAWSGSHGPQTITVCSNTSWYATSNQPNNGGQIETYPDTEYDVGGRANQSTTPISGWNSITSTFAESDPMNGGDSWDAGYDLWTDNWAHETMIWNQWVGGQNYWYTQATGPNGFALSLDGVPYHFFANGSELMFFRDTQVASGSVDILAAYQWEVAHGFANASDIPTQIEYGTEVAYTTGTETFNTTDFGVNMVPTGGTTTTTTSPTTTTTNPTTTTTTSPTTTTTTHPTTTTTTTRPTTTTTTKPSKTRTTTPGNASPPPSPQSSTPTDGYWLVGSDGGIFNYGSAPFEGSTGSLSLQRPVVGITRTSSNSGYWLVASDGGVFAFNAPFVGSLPGLGLHPAGSGLPRSLNQPIVGVVPSSNGQGYYMVAADGGVFAFNSTFAGSCPGIGGCSGATVAVAPDASGNGYWLATATGHIYSFGNAPYFGAPGQQRSAITSMVRTPDGGGYYILDANGQVFAYGDATFLGGLPTGAAGGLNPATAIFDTADGGGYGVSTALGKVYPFGDAPADGDMSGTHLNGSIIAATGF
jgi:hypothetical protein